MFDTIKSLGKHSVIYGLGSILSRVLSVVLLPIHTRFLTPADYGVLSLLTVTGSVSATVTQMAVGSALFREIIFRESDESTAESTALFFLIVESAIVFGALLLLSPFLANIIFKSEGVNYLLRMVFISTYLGVVDVVFMARLRIHNQSLQYTIISVARFLITAILDIYFVAILRRGVEGQITATLLSAAIFTVIFVIILLPHLKLTISIPILKNLLVFGIPTMPANLAYMAMQYIDRYFLNYYSTTAELGIYSLGYSLSSIIALVVQAIQLPWPAQLYSIAKQPNAEKQFAKILTYYLLFMGFISLANSIAAPEILKILATERFYGAAPVVPFITLSYVFYGARFIVNTGLETRNKMTYFSIPILLTALLNVGLNYLLIPPFGMMGATLATFISYAALLVIHTAFNLHFWPIPYEYFRILKISIAWVLTFFSGYYLKIDNVWFSTLVKICLLSLFPTILFVLRFFTADEIRFLDVYRSRILARVRRINYNHLGKSG